MTLLWLPWRLDNVENINGHGEVIEHENTTRILQSGMEVYLLSYYIEIILIPIHI